MTALLENERTQAVVEDIVEIEPLTCSSMQKGHQFSITHMALLRVTFKESSTKASETRTLQCVIVPDSTEDLLIGKPTLDELGFVSDRHTVELRALGLRFCTVLPSECSSQSGGVFLTSVSNESFTAPTAGST